MVHTIFFEKEKKTKDLNQVFKHFFSPTIYAQLEGDSFIAIKARFLGYFK